MKKQLIIVDPQNDFVDPKGSLFVPKATEAIKAICKYILVNGSDIDSIVVSLDSHHPWHVANSGFWKEQPKPYTQITTDLIENGTFSPLVDNDFARSEVIRYMKILGPITIWPEHCIIGTWGHCIPKELTEVLRSWEINHRKRVIYQHKGMFSLYESYSLFTEEKIGRFSWSDENNWMLSDPEEVVISGFAKDICVGETVKAMRTKEKYKGKLRFLDSGLAAINPNNCDIYQDCIDDFGALYV